MREEVRVYHGTVKSDALKIVKNKEFIISNKKDEWLGAGIYFWKYKADAQWWAEKRFRYNIDDDNKPVVIQALIKYDDNRLLDLDDPDQRKLFFNYIKEIKYEMYKDFGGFPQFKTWKEQLCFWCNYCKRIKNIDVIVHTFPDENKYKSRIIQDETGLRYTNNKCQICITDNRIISDIHIIEDNRGDNNVI